ncbi:AbrB/MazE/SpoVT family DNA-binding domain-containing protein [Thermofilum sp.]|jgi:AbrB family looped-hinge helix DNA binding protein|uniref:AbrB/MazE/SpoVT family DNA-binding domain-containing protein n=1 Tax=Thermofilum sp. TaxID=1961369 RepID=UPI00258CA3A3|nr:AbrB/MazE/SpoVT family DNA-binding domain-containing protein [Thermofilum sp.]
MVKNDLSYTITAKGTVTIPAEIRRKYKLKKGSRVKFVETEEGILLVPIVPLEELFGIDKDAKEMVFEMIRELQEERKREASEEK